MALSLQACIVSNILNSPAQQKKSAAGHPAVESLAPLGLSVIAAAQELGQLLGLIQDVNVQLQRIHNHVVFNVKGSGLPGWDFASGVYTLTQAPRGSQVTLKLSDSQGRVLDWDVLDPNNYGAPPRPAKRFPAELTQFTVLLTQPQALDPKAVLKAELTGVPPRQLPLEGNFEIPFAGTGSLEGHPQLTKLTFQVNGKANRDGSLLSGQVSFDGLYNLKSYNGIGSFNQQGLVGRVPIQQNGQAVGEIVPNGAKWNVVIDGKVIATGG